MEKVKKFFKKVTLPNLIFLIGLIVIVIIPNSKFNMKEIDIAERRPLAEFPRLFDNGKINKKFGREFEAAYNDRFRKRNICIDVALMTKAKINGRYENFMGIEGKDGWLFLKGDRSVELYQNKLLFTQEELEKIKNNMERFEKWGKDNGIAVIFITPPDKHRVYEEYFPEHIKKVNPKGRTELLAQYLKENSKVSFIYPLDVFLNKKKDSDEFLYYHTDTHWTRYGAYWAYVELINEINKKMGKNLKPISLDCFDDSDRKTFQETFDRIGDNQKNLKIKGDYEKKNYFTLNKFKKDYKADKNNKDFKVVILGDSFGGELSVLFGFNYKPKHFWYNEKDELFNGFCAKLWEEKILKEKPDVLIVEILERYAYKYLELYKD